VKLTKILNRKQQIKGKALIQKIRYFDGKLLARPESAVSYGIGHQTDLTSLLGVAAHARNSGRSTAKERIDDC
jgi:hypothetical protein